MSRLIINILLYMMIGFMLAFIGATVSTWEYWVIILLVLGISLNNAFNED